MDLSKIAFSLLHTFSKCVTHYDTFTDTPCKDVSGLSEGEWGVAPLSADNTPAVPPFEKGTLHPA